MAVTWTAYGAPAFDQLAATVAAAKAGDPLAPVTVLVPTNLAGVATRRRLAHGVGGHRGVAGLSVLTVDRLAERVAAPTLAAAGRRPATGPVLAAAWRQALADNPGVFAPVAEHPATVRALVTAHRSLRDHAEDLSAIAAHGSVHRDLVRLHRDVLNRLDGFYDQGDLRRAATALLPTHAAEIGAVILFLPQDLSPAAAALVGAIAGLSIVAGCTGDPGADAAVTRTLARLGRASQAPALEPARPGAVRHASDPDDEVRGVVREVLATLATTPADRVAILYGSAQPYARLLAEHLDAAGLTRSGAGVRPTVERALPRLLLDLLALPEHGWRRDEVTSVIARATVRKSDGHRLPSATWERMSREAGVVGGDDWDTRLAAYAAGLVAPADASDAYQRFIGYRLADAHGLRDVVLGLRAHLERGAAITTWPALAEWAREAFALVVGDLGATRLPEEEARAAQRIHSVLSGLSGLGAIEARADVATLRGALELELADDLPRQGRFGTGVLVAPLSESIGLDADVVFVVGLADDLVPGQLGLDALLDDDVRAAGGLPPLRERLDGAHRHLLAALAAARAASIVSYPRGDLRRSTTRLPSRWLDRAAPAVGAPSYAAALASTTHLATEQEWRVRAASAGALSDAIVERAIELAHARASGRLTRFDGDLGGQAIPVPGQDRLTSPTALESWVRCPHGYFLDHLLGIRAVESPEELVVASPLTIGSIIHYSMDEFHQRHGGSGDGAWTAAQRADLTGIARAIAADFTARGLTGHPVLWQRQLIEIENALAALLDQDDELRASTGRRQVRSELAFGMGDAPPVELRLPSGRVVKIRGSADRVDRAGDSIVVVDYKTGSDWSFKEISAENPTAHGTKLQLPVYAHAARAALGTPTTPVAAEYWFIGRSRSRIGVPLTPEVERVFIETVDVIVSGVADGLFPQRPPADDAFGFGCPSCDPDGLGAVEVRRAWSHKRLDPRLAPYLAVVEAA